MKNSLVLTCLLAASLSASVEELDQGDFHIYYPPKQEQLAVFVLNTTREMISKLEPTFGSGLQDVHIYLTDSQKMFEELAGAHLPYWTAAVTIFPKNIIILKCPTTTNSTLRQFRTTVEHEFTHLYQSMIVPLNITPTWFNEGLAIYFSQPYDVGSRVLLSRALLQKRLIPLQKLSDFLKYNHLQAELAYAESASLIEYFTQVYGTGILAEIFHDLRNTKDFSTTLQNLLDSDLESLEWRWRNYITRRYRWIFLLDSHYLIWLIIPILVIIVYFIKGHRNKRIIQQWNREEIETRKTQLT